MTVETQQVIEGEIGRIVLGATAILVVAASEFKGRRRLDCRVYYLAEDGSWLPTKKGISLRAEDLGEFQNLLRRGIAAIAGAEGAAK